VRPLQQNDVFHAIAHLARRAILVLLKDGEKAASELAELFHVSFAAISNISGCSRTPTCSPSGAKDGSESHLSSDSIGDVASWSTSSSCFERRG
jgi:hypothetical protein